MKDDVIIIAGLGNPGPKYALSRHNMGFGAIDYLSEKYGIKVNKIGFKGLYGEGEIEGKKTVLLKPSTYMNDSGVSVSAALEGYSAAPEQLIVLYDDMDIEPGLIRIRPKGSAGTHKGMKSIIYHLQTDQFIRIRIGIGRPPEGAENIDFVLERIPDSALPDLIEGMKAAGEAVACILRSDVNTAMNLFNGKKKE
ncbi:MAG: aminoacyl-tRNA hydrolase [Clostridia bacterium]|jgi:PTH1 family peptidyl-tRNA hydrolase|nr:aminoacyl-tRNA hydrolase [Clostridiaceae bacterium]